MNIRFYNVRILTMKPGQPIFEGELWIEGNLISFVGSKEEKPEEIIAWDREIDGEGNLLMPGFKNAHTHTAMTFLRSYADDLPLQRWLYEQVFPNEAKLEKEDMYYLTKLGIMEYLTSGITAQFDMYLAVPEVARAAVDVGFRTVFCGSINDFNARKEELEEEYLSIRNSNPLLQYRLGFHAEYTTAAEILQYVAELSRKYKEPVFTHLSETKTETDDCIKKTGMTPAAYLDSFGMFEYGGGGFHCVYLSEADQELFKRKNLSVITNPASNVKLASGVAEIQKMYDMGINIGIGTDGAASNNCLDMFREMFLVAGLQKLYLNDAAAMDGNAVLSMATVGSARAMGLQDCDILAKDKKADLIMIDLHQPNMQPLHNISKNLVYAGSKQNVKMTIIDGKILYEDNKFFIGESSEDIYKNVEKITKRVLK